MSHWRSLWTTVWWTSSLVVFFASSTYPTLVRADGGVAKTDVYEATIRLGTESAGTCDFSAEIQPVLFYLGSVNDEYRVLLIHIVNRGASPLRLSRNSDKIELKFESKTVVGEIDLSDQDTRFWDSLDQSMRQALNYPDLVAEGEEDAVFLFVPNGALSGFRLDRTLPIEIRYSIASLHKTIVLRPRGIAAD